ncbi:immunoglobulin-like domain-containing protein, partial [Paenibacillus hemerocallicola]|uniref:immunoglobulin-like domain-containing protein n=1 Tax=Paenibacillus hemerocallicola TaxID=1172614 RepID=UPI00159ED90B
LTLRTTSSLVDSIAWTSDKPKIVDPGTGEVARPAAGQPDAVVTLMAQVSLNGYSDTRSFVLTVKAQASANSKPIASIIPQIDLTVGGAVYEIPYSALATDPDGDELTITGITSSAAIQVVKQANSLSIRAVSAGLPFLWVTVSDGRGGSVTVIIIVRISAAPIGFDLPLHAASGGVNS